ncbi:hypothetical protein CKAH01_17749 [Colletotrichum kahawae]|uniref:Uncharacterized protein n=1 Tax=Colletotrichum kahawae TaxID=34407 RepID=A0AAD9Y9C3_COLKA|nr:hypothetical protein CKAH01_17749 [Colletotrichum kahawae]
MFPVAVVSPLPAESKEPILGVPLPVASPCLGGFSRCLPRRRTRPAISHDHGNTAMETQRFNGEVCGGISRRPLIIRLHRTVDMP